MEGEVASPGLELAWRAEQALNNAWPSLDDVRAGDWSARFGAGLTRRNNSANPRRADARTKIDPVPAPAWLSAKAAFSGLTAAESAIWSKVAARLVVPTGFAGLSEDGALASVAYGAIDDGLLCIEAVVTDPNRRGRGLGRGMLASLIAWGRDLGAMGACLQVQADNSAALALYASLGIGSELYRYHYRRAPAALH